MKKAFLFSLIGVWLLSFFLYFRKVNLSQIVTPSLILKPSPIILESTGEKKLLVVKRVVDGDTIELENGQKVRYIGINTPESVAPNRPVACFAKEATQQNQLLVAGKKVTLEKDISETDKYGRLLRYVYTENNIFVNEYLVRNGFAQAATYPPDVKYSELFLEAQNEARTQKMGLWQACPKTKKL